MLLRLQTEYLHRLWILGLVLVEWSMLRLGLRQLWVPRHPPNAVRIPCRGDFDFDLVVPWLIQLAMQTVRPTLLV